MKENWTYKKLGEVCEIYQPKTISMEMLVPDGQYLAYGSNGIIGKFNNYNHIDSEVVMACRGTCGQINITKPYSWINGNAMVIHPKKMNLTKPYLAYQLKGVDISKVISGTSIPQITRQSLSVVMISIPPLPIQQQIVSELDLLQGIIDKQQAQLKELDNLAQAVFYEMFGDPVENEKGWEVKHLEEIVAENCPISYGIVQPGEGVDNGIPVVRPIDMTHTFVYRSGLKQTTKEISDSYKRTILKGNEILVCVRGTTGLVALASEELIGCNVTRGIAPIECNVKNNRWFVYYQFLTKGIQQYIAEYTKGIALKQINIKDVREIPFIVPPLSLQQSFAAMIESIEKQKVAISQSIAETQKLFDYTMDKYFGE